MKFLSVSDVIDLHKISVNKFGGLLGIRDKNLLESAIGYPKLLYAIGQERDTYILAGAYCYHLINNHPFLDGNKRIGILAMLTFLHLNDVSIHISKNKLYDLAMKVARSEIDELEIAVIIKN